MVFQPKAFLNPRSAVSGAVSLRKSGAAVLAISLALAIFNVGPCLAEGFPGKGNPHDWSEALPYYNLANRYMQKERYEDAIAKYQEAIARYEYDPDFYINLGVAFRKMENFEGAEDAFKKAAALNAKDWMAWSNLANSYLKQDRLQDTMKAFEQALKCNPPVEEKEAILKDIADIKKILSMRNGGAMPPEMKSDTPAAKIISGKRSSSAGGNASKYAAAKSAQKKAPNSAAKTTQKAAQTAPSLIKQTAREAAFPKKADELKDTGWDEVAK